MTNSYCHFSEYLKVKSTEEAAWICSLAQALSECDIDPNTNGEFHVEAVRILKTEDMSSHSLLCSPVYVEGRDGTITAVWIRDSGGGSDPFVAGRVASAFYRKFGYESERFVIRFAEISDKLRPDEIGGGVVCVNGSSVVMMTTNYLADEFKKHGRLPELSNV